MTPKLRLNFKRHLSFQDKARFIMLSKTTPQLKEWTRDFGRKYTLRNKLSFLRMQNMYKEFFGLTRMQINQEFLNKLSRKLRILEVGTNIGNQLLCLQKMGFSNLYGIEPQAKAVEILHSRIKGLSVIQGNAFDLPFKDGYFDLVFTSGVLTHIHPRDIKIALREIYRCSRKYIWGLEAYAPECQEVKYRGKSNMFWKANYVRLYLELFSDLRLVKEKKLKYHSDKNTDIVFLLKKAKVK